MDKTGFDFLREFAAEVASGTLDLPPFPDVAMRVRKILDDPNCAVDRAARVISTEPVLSAKMIRMANSAAFRQNDNTVTKLSTAITRIGFDMAKNAAISIAMEQVFDTKNSAPLKSYITKLWHHSIKVAAISYVLARRLKSISPDEAMLAGLVHDIGKFYILTRTVKYPELFGEDESLQELMKQWHAGIGKAILESWDFSEEMTVAVDEHETLERTHTGATDLTDLLTVANLLSYIGDPTSSPYKHVNYDDVPSFRKMGLDEKVVIEILAQSKKITNSLAQSLHT